MYHRMTPAERQERIWKQTARPPTPRPGSRRSRKARVVAMANGYCDWSDMDAFVNIYRVCAVLNELDLVPGGYVVDHVVPMLAPTVSGLHTHTNLRIVTARENQTKGNFFWPDMWPHDWSTLQAVLKHGD